MAGVRCSWCHCRFHSVGYSECILRLYTHSIFCRLFSRNGSIGRILSGPHHTCRCIFRAASGQTHGSYRSHQRHSAGIGSGDRRSDSRPMGLEGSICGSRRFRRHHSRTVAWTERIARRVKAILWIHTPVIRRLPSSFRQLPVHGSCMFQRRSSGTVVRLYIVGAVHIADPLWPVADILWFRYRFQLAVCSERINACPSVSPSEKSSRHRSRIARRRCSCSSHCAMARSQPLAFRSMHVCESARPRPHILYHKHTCHERRGGNMPERHRQCWE